MKGIPPMKVVIKAKPVRWLLTVEDLENQDLHGAYFRLKALKETKGLGNLLGELFEHMKAIVEKDELP
jgi:hypothetical protein